MVFVLVACPRVATRGARDAGPAPTPSLRRAGADAAHGVCAAAVRARGDVLDDRGRHTHPRGCGSDLHLRGGLRHVRGGRARTGAVRIPGGGAVNVGLAPCLPLRRRNGGIQRLTGRTTCGSSTPTTTNHALSDAPERRAGATRRSYAFPEDCMSFMRASRSGSALSMFRASRGARRAKSARKKSVKATTSCSCSGANDPSWPRS